MMLIQKAIGQAFGCLKPEVRSGNLVQMSLVK